MLDLEFSQKLLFVTGKGGTGKSFLASILAVKYAAQGKKVLLIDAESTGDTAEHFEHSQVGYDPVEVSNNIFILQSRTDEALSEYLKLNAKIPTWTKVTPLARLIDLVSNAAPGVKEILVTGKICFEAKQIIDGESDFEMIIVDAPSSGHVISMLDAPRALAELVSKGMIQEQTKWMQEILNDKKFTGVVVVTTTDEVVLRETNDLIGKIEDLTKVSIAGIVINKDIANLSIESQEIQELTPVSENIGKIREYYKSGILRTRKIAQDFQKYPLFSLPFTTEKIPSLRTSMKYSKQFLRAKVGTK